MNHEEPRTLRCAWVVPAEDPGARLLVPGCVERVLDWDAECTCKTTDQEHAEALARIAELEAELKRDRDAHHALIAAVGRHKDARKILEASEALRRQWMAATERIR